VYIVGAFVGVHGLKVRRDPHHVKFVRDAVAAMHVSGCARDVERLPAAVALDQRDRLGSEVAAVEKASRTQARLEAYSDLGLHVRQFLLYQLIGGERPSELLAIENVLPSSVPAELGLAERTPCDPIPGHD
jgi:hypothetical protein